MNWSGVKLLRLGACEPVMCTGKRPVLWAPVVTGRGATAGGLVGGDAQEGAARRAAPQICVVAVEHDAGFG